MEKGDGWKYRGMGGIHLTGKGNYQEFSKYIKRPDIVNNPELVAKDPKLAAQAAAWFWKKHKNGAASKAALKGDFKGARNVVNNGDAVPKVVRLSQLYLNGKGKIVLPK